MVKISTSQFAYRGSDRFDITYKTGNSIFAPTKEMVYDYKYKGLSIEMYTKLYIQLMDNSYAQNRYQWDQILTYDTVVFVCYCQSNTFCHRILLANIFVQLGAEYCGEILLNKE